MGKPFKTELSRLSDTYDWANGRELAKLEPFIQNRSKPAYFIGSGGSLSGAAYGAYLYRLLDSGLGVAVTPLEFSSQKHLDGSSVFIYSAAGGNVDVIGAFRHAVNEETDNVAVLCLNPDSKLAAISREYEYVDLWTEASPANGDGFLATNSLLVFFVLTHRLFHPDVALPSRYKELDSLVFESGSEMEEVVCRDHLIVLYGPSTYAAALDLESKMSEAGLASVQLADYRNFAHGRHNWIAKKAKSTAVLSICATQDESIADRTHKALTGVCPLSILKIKSDPSIASLAALPYIFKVTQRAGETRGIDPGRPGVPPFGRQIYNLRPSGSAIRPGSPPALHDVVRRKLRFAPSVNRQSAVRRTEEAARAAHKLFRTTIINCLVLDFDDTVCGRNDRFGQLPSSMRGELERIASHGTPIGIATGRGQSVRSQLRNSIDEELWPFFTIGYYNGAKIAPLIDDSDLNSDCENSCSLKDAAEILAGDSVVRSISSTTVRRQQISLDPLNDFDIHILWMEVCRSLSSFPSALKIVCSSRSVDVLESNVSKLRLVDTLKQGTSSCQGVLCIGDRGAFPGNDFELLREPLSLSSDQCSNSLESCWNFAPVGYRRAQATEYYLRKLHKAHNGLKLKLPDLR